MNPIRGSLLGVTVTALAIAAGVMVAPSVSATPSNITLHVYSTYTSASFTTGTGQIRAKQQCNTSNGQSSWTQYGYWVSKNLLSQTGTCTYRTPYSSNYEVA
jgi:hypothetical protein